MDTKHDVELRGCSPEPLMAYLKALGAFRLVTRQADANARAWWRRDVFVLQSKLDRDGLVDFFLSHYRPTPVVSPWNGGSGFYPKDNSSALNTILAQQSPRFRPWQKAIATGRQILAELPANDSTKTAERKRQILAECRKRFDDAALDWLDAAYVLTPQGPRFPPLIGTGGNDGRLEFSNNFMQNAVSALQLDRGESGEGTARARIEAALFADGAPLMESKRSSGFYNPGGIGGPNASVGFDRDPMTNPWDYVLTLEGVLTFAGAAARRLSAVTARMAFPFTVDNVAAGYGTAVASEYGSASRSEFWAPIWERPATFPELEHLAGEGRASLGRKQAANGAEFARAVAGLGVERGISKFQRFGFLERNGRAYLSVPLGQIHNRNDQATTERTGVLFDLDPWLESMRREATGNRAPSGLSGSLRAIDAAIIEFCQNGQPHALQEVLIAVGRGQQWLARSGLTEKIRPLSHLSAGWLEYADDNSPEFRLAAALASVAAVVTSGQVQVGPIRENLEPVTIASPTPQWRKNTPSFVWIGNDTLSNMLAVLERRCLEARMLDLEQTPLSARRPAHLTDIASFLDGSVNVQRIAELALPLSYASYFAGSGHPAPNQGLLRIPAAYAVMKLTLLPEKFHATRFSNEDKTLRPDSRMLALLRAGRASDAYQAAHRRLTASGLRPWADKPPIPDHSGYTRRLAAALLFPIHPGAHSALATNALRPPDRPDTHG